MLAAQQQGIEDATLSLWGGISGMLLAVFWAYTALESISFVGSEVKTPRTAFMRGMTIGFVAVMALYLLNAWLPGVSFGSDFVRDYSYLYNTSDASYAALQAAMGGATPPIPSIPFYAAIDGGIAWLSIALGVGFMCWFLNTSVIIWMASVRGLFAMSFDRQLPLSLCNVSKKGVPTTATHLIGIVSLIGCFIGLGDALGDVVGRRHARDPRLDRHVLHLVRRPRGHLPAVHAARPLREEHLPAEVVRHTGDDHHGRHRAHASGST